MPRVILFNKPYGVICRFTPESGHPCLKDFIHVPGFYPAGRLDTDSEGLLVLTDDGALQHRIADPRHKLPKTYWVQVEGVPDAAALERLQSGVKLSDLHTRPARARLMPEPQGLWPRVPPIRVRRHIPTAWLEILLQEGKNRQVRRMTAAVGLPALRLIRHAIGPWTLGHLAPGEWRMAEAGDALSAPHPRRQVNFPGNAALPRRNSKARGGSKPPGAHS